MNYAKIIKYDTGNWDGINSTIFFSGCNFKCKGCFNAELQDFNYGKRFTTEVADSFIETANNPHIDGVCILGGEPFQQDLYALLMFVKRVKEETKKPIHVWTGYVFERLLEDPIKYEILSYIDTVVDGQFDIAKKDLNLKFRGSSNQRVIDVQESLFWNKTIEIK